MDKLFRLENYVTYTVKRKGAEKGQRPISTEQTDIQPNNAQHSSSHHLSHYSLWPTQFQPSLPACHHHEHVHIHRRVLKIN